MEKKKKTLINIAYYTVIIGIMLLAGKYLLPVLLPFCFAFFAASAAVKAADGIGRRIHRKWKVLPFLLVAIFYLFILAGIVYGGSRFLPAVGRFVTNLPELYRTEISPFLESVMDKLEHFLMQADPQIVNTVSNWMTQITENLSETLGDGISAVSMTIVKVLSKMALNTPAIIIVIVVTVIASFYFVSDYVKVLQFFCRVIPEKGLSFLRNIKNHGLRTIKIYIRSYALLLLLTFSELLIGFLILRLPYPGWIALGIAIFDILPVLGTGGILLPWAVILCLLKNYPLAAGILILYLVITVIRNILEPKIVGKQMGLHPLASLVALYTGLKLFGLIGMILFPMTLSILAEMDREGVLRLPWMKGKENKEDVDS